MVKTFHFFRTIPIVVTENIPFFSENKTDSGYWKHSVFSLNNKYFFSLLLTIGALSTHSTHSSAATFCSSLSTMSWTSCKQPTGRQYADCACFSMSAIFLLGKSWTKRPETTSPVVGVFFVREAPKKILLPKKWNNLYYNISNWNAFKPFTSCIFIRKLAKAKALSTRISFDFQYYFLSGFLL